MTEQAWQAESGVKGGENDDQSYRKGWRGRVQPQSGCRWVLPALPRFDAGHDWPRSVMVLDLNVSACA